MGSTLTTLMVVVSMNYNQIFIGKKVFCVMYGKIEICLMLLSAVKFRQNTCIGSKQICKCQGCALFAENLQKLRGTSSFWENLLDSFSCCYFEIAYSNVTF